LLLALKDVLHSLIVSCRRRSVPLDAHFAKEPSLERAFHRPGAVATLIGHRAKCVLLLEREARRQSAEPPASLR
jgi:hypothetical protein